MSRMAHDKRRSDVVLCVAMSLESLLEMERLRKKLYMNRDAFVVAACREYVERRRGERR